MINTKRSLYIALGLLFLLSLINYLDRVALSVAGSSIAKEFGLSPIQMGYFFSSFLWSYAICVIPAGIIADRLGARRVIGGGISLWSLATIATGLASGFGSIIATRVVMGAGEATSYPGASRLIREHVPEANRGFAMAIFNSGAYAGPAFGSILIAWLISLVGWRNSFMIAGAIGFVWLVLWTLFFKAIGAHSEATAASKSSEKTAGNSIAELLQSPSVWGTALTQGLSIYALYFLLTWLPTYLQTTRGLDVRQSGLVSAIPYIGAVVLNILIGRLSDGFKGKGEDRNHYRRTLLGVMMLVSAVLLFTPFIGSTFWIVVLFTVSLTGISTAGSLNMALANDLSVNVADAAKVNSLVVLGGNIFGIMAPIVTGYIVSGTGSYDYAFIIAGVLLVIGAVISQVLTRSPIGGDYHGRPSRMAA